MRLTGLRIRHFRNLGVQELEVPPEGVALVGENAQGKTNFLEAVYYLETFRSFRGARDDQLVAFDEDVFRVAGGLGGAEAGEDALEIAAAFQKRGRRKKVTVDGSEPDRIGDALGKLGAVIFSPSDVALVNDGPSERRRFLDIVLSLNEPGYLKALQVFRHTLSQRNAALKEERPAALVRAFDEGLVRAGARVMRSRRRWIEARGPAFSGYYERVAGGQRVAMAYVPSVSPEKVVEADEAGAAEAYREALERAADKDRRLGTTTAGPHRDEVTFTLEGDERGVDVRDFGSGGQRRTVALALRLVEARTIREARGLEPLVLMDDVFAELDAGRSERVLELMEREETGQVILTAPKEGDIRLRKGELPRWGIVRGVVRT